MIKKEAAKPILDQYSNSLGVIGHKITWFWYNPIMFQMR